MRTRWLLLAVAVVAAAIWFPWPKDSHVEAPAPAPPPTTTSEDSRPVLQPPAHAPRPPRPHSPQPAPTAPPPADSAAPPPAEGSIDVRVFTPDRRPVPRFEARLSHRGGYHAFGQQTDGRLIVGPPSTKSPGLPAGSVLEIWNARDAAEQGLGLGPQRVGPFTGTERTLEVVLEAVPVLEGIVLGPDGPLATAVGVKLGPLERWWETFRDEGIVDAGVATHSTELPPRLPYEGLRPSALTDASGRFRIEFLRPGIVHRLDVVAPEQFCSPESRRVSAGDGPLEIRLQRPAVVRVTVLGPDRQPLPGVHVTALEPGGNGYGYEVSATTNAEGIARLGAKDENRFSRRKLDSTEKYKLVLNANYEPGIVRDEPLWRRRAESKPAGPPYFAERALDDWVPADTTVRLEYGHIVAGKVLDSSGHPLRGCHVGICTPVGFGCYETTSEGRFEFRGIPAGTVYLGLDHGGDMGGIVDHLRETMWDASFGGRRQYSPESPPPVREWTTLEVADDRTDVTFRLPATTSVRVNLPPRTEDENLPDDDRFSTRRFDATQVSILHLTEKGWEHPDGATNAFREPGGPGGRTVEVKGLFPGHTYAAWMTPIAGEYVYAEFSADVGSLKLERTRGRTLRGQILNRPPDSSRVRIDVWDSRSRWVRTRSPDPAGGFQIDGLPESTWTVRAWCRSADDVIWIAKEEVATGERLELRLAPQPKAEGE